MTSSWCWCSKFCLNTSAHPCMLRNKNWSTRPTTVPASSDHYFHTECPSVRPKTSKSSYNHCRPGLWAGRVDHWLLSCNLILILFSFLTWTILDVSVLCAFKSRSTCLKDNRACSKKSLDIICIEPGTRPICPAKNSISLTYKAKWILD